MEGLEDLMKTNSPVYHMEKDKRTSGRYIYSSGGLLQTVSLDGKNVATIHNSTSHNITSFYQLNKDRVIFFDSAHQCIRQLSRETGTVERCFDWRLDVDKEGALFDNESGNLIGFDESGDTDLTLIVTSKYKNGSLLKYDKRSDNITVLISGLGGLPGGIARHDPQDGGDGSFYIITLKHAVYRIYQHNGVWDREWIAGSKKNKTGSTDGSFCVGLFNHPSALFLIPTRESTQQAKTMQLYVADTNNHKIRILDLKAKAIDSICSGTEGHTNGNFNDCQMSFPRSIFSRSIISRDKPNSTTLYYDPYLIIGESGRIRKVGSKLFFLFYLKYALPYLVSDFTIIQLERLVLWLYPFD